MVLRYAKREKVCKHRGLRAVGIFFYLPSISANLRFLDITRNAFALTGTWVRIPPRPPKMGCSFTTSHFHFTFIEFNLNFHLHIQANLQYCSAVPWIILQGILPVLYLYFSAVVRSAVLFLKVFQKVPPILSGLNLLFFCKF